MASKKAPDKKVSAANATKGNATKSSARATVGGPSVKPGKARATATDRLSSKVAGTAELAASFPYNKAKAAEHSRKGPPQTPAGQTAAPNDPLVTSSTLTELNPTTKAGTRATPSVNATIATLDRVRVDSSNQRLTTNQGVPVADNQNSLKAGLRGPALLEDFILREKITHFDHERIPERVVHARGSGAHGFFECYEPLTRYTRSRRRWVNTGSSSDRRIRRGFESREDAFASTRAALRIDSRARATPKQRETGALCCRSP